MAEIRQILHQDSIHKFELATNRLSNGPGIYCSLSHHVKNDDGAWEVTIPWGIKTMGTKYNTRATRSNLDALHRGCLDAAREIVSECSDDPTKFEAQEKAKLK